MSLPRLSLLFATAAIVTGTLVSHVAVDPPPTPRPSRPGATAQVIVGVEAPFVPEGHLASPAEVAAQRRAIATAVTALRTRAATAGVTVGAAFDYIPFFEATVTAASFDRLAAIPGVRSIEPVRTFKPALSRTVPLVRAPTSWAAGATGAGWTVAVLDTGIQSNHPFLTGKVTSEACYSQSGGLFTSICPGGGTSSTAVGSGAPCMPGNIGPSCGHGTQVAGVATGKNGTGGLNGVAPDASLISIQVYSTEQQCLGIFTCTSATSSNIINGLGRVLTLAGANNTNRIASAVVALSDVDPGSAMCDATYPAMKAAIDNLRSIGIPTVAPSGNNGSTTLMGLPACISTAVSVGATSPVTGQMYPASARVATLSLVAPGGGHGTNEQIRTSTTGGTYTNVNVGTSMAAAHVAGAWAVIKQSVPGASVSDVLAALRSTGTPVADPTIAGRTYPFIDIEAARVALGGTPGPTNNPPGAPSNFAATVSGNVVNMSWAAPTVGGAPTAYTILARTSPGGPVLASLPVGLATTFGVAAPNGVFSVSVRASNSFGTGAESLAVTVTVPQAAPPPGPPSGLAATVAGNAATFTWNAPASGGAVTGYTLLAGVSPGFSSPIASMPLPASPRSVGIAGIPPGTYYVRVLARNGGGTSAASNEVSVTIAGPTAPGAPTLNAAVVTGNTVALSWTPGGGGTPSGYVLRAAVTPGGAPILTAPIGATSAAFGGVPNGTYYVRVAAVNAVGTSPLSNEITIVVP